MFSPDLVIIRSKTKKYYFCESGCWHLRRLDSNNLIAEISRAKRAPAELAERVASGVSKSTHPRKFGNQLTVHRTNDRPSAPQAYQCSISRFLASLGAKENWYGTHIAHQCCDQLTAVKTGYPLTGITWPSHGLRCPPIEFEYFLKLSVDQLLVFKWSQAQV